MRGILLRVRGPWARFTRPELKVEAVTYDVMTPTAAKAILGAIYRKPEMEWVVDEISVLKPIQTISMMLNYITGNGGAIINAGRTASVRPVDVTSMRDQRNTTILRDVDYVIRAHFDIVSGENNPGKHQMMFLRRALQGQCFRHPYFGCREFSVREFYPVKDVPESPLKGIIRLGFMLHSIDYANGQKKRFFNAVLENGRMAIPPVGSPEVKQ